MFFTGLSEYYDIFQVDYYEIPNKVFKRLIHEDGEDGGGIGQAEIHDSALE